MPAFGDLDGDGDLDSIVGNRSGGLLFYSNGLFQVGIAAPPDIPGDRTMNLRVEPNPSSGRVTFRFDGDVSDDTELAVSDSLGRTVARLPVASAERFIEWDGADAAASDMASGVYVVRLVSAEHVLAATSFTRIR
ncbi:MAG: hypothetical protein IIB09_09810 [Bacteroidetes bacterium]|nr:hypothetical protein [Bacteroidota bacterium]